MNSSREAYPATEAIFSMPMSDLIAYSDIVIERRPPGSVLEAQDSIVAFTNDTTDADGMAIDNGLVVVDGDLTLTSTSTTKIRGMLYVNGNLRVEGLFYLYGSLVVNGGAQLVGTTDPIEIHYDPDAYTRLSDLLSRYRLPRAFKPGG